jgi:hypothetical protein
MFFRITDGLEQINRETTLRKLKGPETCESLKLVLKVLALCNKVHRYGLTASMLTFFGAGFFLRRQYSLN